LSLILRGRVRRRTGVFCARPHKKVATARDHTQYPRCHLHEYWITAIDLIVIWLIKSRIVHLSRSTSATGTSQWPARISKRRCSSFLNVSWSGKSCLIRVCASKPSFVTQQLALIPGIIRMDLTHKVTRLTYGVIPHSARVGWLERRRTMRVTRVTAELACNTMQAAI